MNQFWIAALSFAGAAAVAAFVFYALYRDWLKLSVFSQMTKLQTFKLMRMFLVLVFLALLVLVAAWLFRAPNAASGEVSPRPTGERHEFSPPAAAGTGSPRDDVPHNNVTIEGDGNPVVQDSSNVRIGP